MTTLKTNSRSDRLMHIDIYTHYREYDFYFMKSTLLGIFAQWVVRQSPYDTPDISKALEAFNEYLTKTYFPNSEDVIRMKLDELDDYINEDILEAIPEIEILNHPKIGTGSGFSSRYHTPHPDEDFIDLGALARNIKVTLMREYITENGSI